MESNSEIIHRPIRAPRKNHIGEQLIAAMWTSLMRDENDIYFDDYPLKAILYEYPFPVGQREASVAASLVCWLAANVGLGFMDAAMSKSAATARALASGDLMIESWSVRNRRVGGIDHGWRAIEHILATEEQIASNTLPELSMRDCEVCEHVLVWFAVTAIGRKFWQLFVTEHKRISRGGEAGDPDELIARIFD